MLVSTKGRYALRMMIELASRTDRFSSLRDISGQMCVSVKYLEQIAAALYKAGLLQSARGAGGGYRLARPASEITAGDILRASEGNLASIACVDGKEGENCAGCPSRDFWVGLQATINEYADKYTLEALAQG